jgi:hypothetical protein
MFGSLMSSVFQVQAATHLLVIGGIGGEPQYTTLFHAWATGFIETAVERFEVPLDNVHYLAERTSLAPELVEARSTREEVENVISELATVAGVDDHILIVLFGHGSEGGGIPKFNLPGPDVTASEFAVLVGALAPRPVTIVNTSSSSGGFISHLSGPNRIVITATRSGNERNEARFAGFFVEAFNGGADVDKDNRISMLEAFNYARLEVERAYQQDNLIQSEHALLDDNADGEGSSEPDPLQSDGALARRVFLNGPAGSILAGVSDDPELLALYQEKARLEEAVQQLRAQKNALVTEEYEDRLEDLIVELSFATRAIREREAQ